jgi:AraC family transcriptional regulator
MGAPADAPPALARIEGGTTRGLPGTPRGSVGFARDWGAVRAIQFSCEAQDVPEGALVNHVVSLNLGPDATCEASFEGGPWVPQRAPHHGLAVYPSLLPHALRGLQPREFLLVELAPEFVAGVAAAAGAGELRPLSGVQDAFARHVLLALAEEARRDTGAGTLRAEGLATALVAHLLERDARVVPAAALVAALPSAKLRRVLDYVASHLDAPLTIRKLAELAEMDQFRFIRAFKQSTGLSPHRYVLEARIARAKDLLRDRALSITDIALQTGFATPSHFSVTFRRLANATPRSFRDGLR